MQGLTFIPLTIILLKSGEVPLWGAQVLHGTGVRCCYRNRETSLEGVQ